MERTRLDDLPPAVRDALRPCTVEERKFVVTLCGPAYGNLVTTAKLLKWKGTYASKAHRAHRLSRLPRVRAAIEAWVDAFALSAAETIAAIGDLAGASLAPFLEVTPDGLKLRAITDEVWSQHAGWIKEIETTAEGKVTRIRLHDRLKALDMLAKVRKLYADAPVVNVFMAVRRMSDEDLMAAVDAEVRGLGGKEIKQLTAGKATDAA